MPDRVTSGLLAGTVAGAAQAVLTLSSFRLGFSKYRWRDFASAAVFGRLPKNTSESLFSEVVMLVWSGFLGAIYSEMLTGIGKSNNRLKGPYFGLTSWFTFYAIAHMFNLRSVVKTDMRTATIHAVSSAMWGLIMNESLKALMEKRQQKPDDVQSYQATNEDNESVTTSLN